MSMGYLLPKSTENKPREDAAVVWRGLMVQKAVQQLLFDVDWRASEHGPGLDVLVIDMPPGTGDVPLTLGQLVVLNGVFTSLAPTLFASAHVPATNRGCHHIDATRRRPRRRTTRDFHVS